MSKVLEIPKLDVKRSLMADPDRDFFKWSHEQLNRYGIILPKNGKGTFAEIMALVHTFPPMEEGEKHLFETIMEERVERRKQSSKKA